MEPLILPEVILWLFLATLPLACLAALIALLLSILVSRFSRSKNQSEKHKTNLPLSIGIASLIFTLAVCAQLYFTFAISLNAILRPPTNADLIGVWVPNEKALTWMQENGFSFSKHALEFNGDSTCVVTNIPGTWIDATLDRQGRLDSGHCIWKIEQTARDEWEVVVHFSSMTLGTPDQPVRFGWSFRSDSRLYFPLETGTNREWITFEKCDPRIIRMNDERLKPFLAALEKVDRTSMGFTSLSSHARVIMNGKIGDAFVSLSIIADTINSISFRQVGGSYVWVSERETIKGPAQFKPTTTSELQNEQIIIDYRAEPVKGVPDGDVINTTLIYYWGGDTTLARDQSHALTLKEAQPILERWKHWRLQQPPSPDSLCPQ